MTEDRGDGANIEVPPTEAEREKPAPGDREKTSTSDDQAAIDLDTVRDRAS
ncbi:MAG: hypothetical protein QOJ91_1895 [Sphingomonadales bacterium]|jgi:hypothetical protein|nr:hypothetical protein [Sphingomonadales bacterium]